MTQFIKTHQRQIHLDFHTSPFIDDVGVDFDPKAFAKTMKEAHVNSVTVFSKCHHGMCYYPTKSGVVHPAIGGRDLLGEQIEALHREGIRAPIYTTVAWEEDVANRFPEWRQIRKDGHFAQIGNAMDFNEKTPGGWRFMNYLHPDYQDYIEAHVRELLDNYDVDGIFFDIMMYDKEACWSDSSRKFREEHGFMSDDPVTQMRFQAAAQDNFSSRFTRLVQGAQPEATVFYNGIGTHLRKDSGLKLFEDNLTHLELESLPSGFWGYLHFPRFARYAARTGKNWMGMTGRFQKMWGDFGGLKPQEALEYECFRSQAMGGSSSVGDQLPPRGVLDQGAYDLIGSVYSQWEKAEPFYEGSVGLPQVGIFQSATDVEVEGAIQICDELHYDSVVLDETSSVEGLDLLILPDRTTATPEVRQRVEEHMDAGGKVLFSHRSGFAEGKFALSGIGLEFAEDDLETYPSYWRTKESFDAKLSRSERVIYEPGTQITKVPDGFDVLVERVLPYFKRTDLKYCSHFQAPPVKEPSRHPAAVGNNQVVYFADPVFAEYRRAGNIAARDGVRRAIENLIGRAEVGHGLASTIFSVPRRREDDLIITLMHYVPLRKALEIDVIDERMSFAGQVLQLAPKATTVREFDGGELESLGDGRFALPTKSGRLLLEVPGYFK